MQKPKLIIFLQNIFYSIKTKKFNIYQIYFKKTYEIESLWIHHFDYIYIL